MTLDEINSGIDAAQEDLENLLARRAELVENIATYAQRIIEWGNTPNPDNPEPTERRQYYGNLKAAAEEELADVQSQIDTIQGQIDTLISLQAQYISASAEAASLGLVGEAAEQYAQGKLSEEKKANTLKYVMYIGLAILVIAASWYLFKKARK